MSSNSFKKIKYEELRNRAERLLDNSDDQRAPRNLGDIKSVIHELEIFQMELEIQNEELCRSQAALETSRDRYEDLYDGAPVGYLTLDREGLIVEANLTVATLLGVPRGRLLGSPLSGFVFPDDQDIWYLHRAHVFGGAGPRTDELRFQRPDTTTFFAQLESRPEFAAHGCQKFRTVLFDISARRGAQDQASVAADELERKNAELQRLNEQLQASEFQRLRSAAIDASNDGLVITDACRPDNPIVFASQPFLTLTGYSEAEVLGKNCRFLQGPDSNRQTVTQIREAIAAPRMFEGEILNYCKNGESFWNHLRIHPLFDGQGNLTHFVGKHTDVTERKQMEKMLRRSDRLASTGTLAAGIAHEINNPISAAWTAAETILRIQGKPNSNVLIEEALHAIISSVQRCDKIIQNVLRFSRSQPSDMSPHNINEVVQRGGDMARDYAKQNNVGLVYQLTDDLPQPTINAVEIQQVVVNLLHNAIEANQDLAEITVSTAAVGDAVSFSVKDGGRGISEVELPQVFDPFYTARPGGRGVGLGLSIAHGIVEDHRGTIEMSSEIGKGTTATVKLPVPAIVDASAAT
ncbi:PAS domain-containing protein [Pirellulales bacterium]|nr:PAS domain-containing protein [Pirellulales bacterium]